MADLEVESKPNGSEQVSNGLPNGIANGTSEHKDRREHKHKSKDRDREKDKDRHRDKDRHKSSHKDKDRDKEKSRDKDKDRHSSSHKSSHKDKDRDKDRDKDKDKSRDKDKDRHRDKERSDKDKDKSKDDKHRDRERSDKDKERSGDKDKERSGDKDKERSGDKDKERKDRDKDRHHRDKDRHHRDDKDKRNSSSSSKKDRHHSSSHKSSHKDKHRDRDREKEKEREKEREREKHAVKEEQEQKMEELVMKEEEEEEEVEPVIKEEQESIYEDPSMEMEEERREEESEEDPQLVIKEEKMEEEEPNEDDDIPLSARKRVKEECEGDEDDKPLIARKKVKTAKKKRKKRDEDYEEDFKPVKKVKKEKAKRSKVKNEPNKSMESPTKKKKKEEEEHVWRWWEEEKKDDGNKWTFLEHKGPVFADPYIRLPKHVKFYYNGEQMMMSQDTEETSGFYAKMLDHDYATKQMFNKNFFKDWRKVMSSKEKEKITDLSKCDFRGIHAYYTEQNELRKNRSKEEKKALKEKNEKIIAEYGWCNIDGHKQRIGNFKIEPPGLFRGRGEHPKQGMVKKRTMPEDVRINCSKDSKIPQAPEGHRWKEVRHDTAVTWLACWNENIQGSTKYVMLNAASKLKGEKDWQKYETARRLHKHVEKIRDSYKMDWKSKEMRIRQRGVALYFIDKLALRAGNEKDEDQADTVGCCSLRVEHLKLFEKKGGKDFVVTFDFLGKDSIRYFNEVPVEKRVFKNLQLFIENKQEADDVFDRLNTQILNKYLNELLEGLTAKVFRTYNASRTLQEQLEKLTNSDDPIPNQILTYNRANREVAILCNHQRAVPKTFDKSMANLQKKIDDKKDLIHDVERELKDLKKEAKHGGSAKSKINYDKKKKSLERLREQLEKLEISATDKEENKQIALGTSKLNYLDPRITVAWCKKNNIPVDKVYNKTQRQKFQWAIDMATADYVFTDLATTDKKFKGDTTGGDDDNDEDDEED